jgi:hypothetical protein
MDELFWARIFFNGGGAVVAILCIAVALHPKAQRAMKLLLWIVAISLLLIQAGCLFLAQSIGRATGG